MIILLRQFTSCAAVAFVVISLIVAPAFTAEPGSEEEFEQLMAHTTQRLGLNPEQAKKIRPRLKEQLEEMRELFASYRYGGAGSLPSLMQEFEEMREDFRVDMDVHLTDQQMLVFMELRKEVDESIRDTVIDYRLDGMRESLGLSDEQVAAVRPIVADNFDERDKLMSYHIDQAGGGARLRRNLGPEVKQADEKMEKRLQGVLTRAQMDQYHEFLAEKRQYLREAEAVSQ